MKKRVWTILTAICLTLMLLPTPVRADRGLLDGVPDGYIFHLDANISDEDFGVTSGGWYAFEVNPMPQNRHADIKLYSYQGESSQGGKYYSTTDEIRLLELPKSWNNAGDTFYVQLESGIAYNVEARNGKAFDVAIRCHGTVKPDDISSFDIDMSYFMDNGGTAHSPGEAPLPGDKITVALFANDDEADAAFSRYYNNGQYAIVISGGNGIAEVTELIVTLDDGTSFSVKNDGSNTFSFTMPEASVSLSYTASWEGESGYGNEFKNPFTDISESDPFYDAVQWAIRYGITTGTSKTTFSPQATVTRAQAMTFLWRSANCPEPSSSDISFTDVKPTDYFYKAVLWAVENGITNGTGNGKFSPEQTCTHAHMVTFSWRFLGKENETGQGAWYDDALSWYTSMIGHLVEDDATPVESGTLTDITNAVTSQKLCSRADAVNYLYLNDEILFWQMVNQ